MNPFGRVRNQNRAARARRAVRHAPWLEALEGRALLTTVTQFADSGVFTSVTPAGAIGPSEGLGTGGNITSLGNGDTDEIGFDPFNPTLHAVPPPGQPFPIAYVSVGSNYQHNVGSVTSVTLTVQMQFSYAGDTSALTHVLQFTTQIQVAYAQVALPPAYGPGTIIQHKITVNPVVFTTSNVLPGSDLEFEVVNLPASVTPIPDSTGSVPIMGEIVGDDTPPPPPDVNIDINDTTDKSDDIVLYNPPGSAQPFTQTIPARVTNTGAAGTIQLSVVPAGSATLSQTSVDLAAGASTEVTVTPTAVSHAVNDVKLVAMSNGNVVGSQTMTIVSVTLPQHIRYGDTPDGMPDRIPPRVNDYQVPITVTPDLGSSGQSVTLFIDSTSPLDGKVDINGQNELAITSSGNVTLQGTQQTAATDGADASDLSLDVRVHGADTPVRSAGFSVAAIPVNWNIAFKEAATGNSRGIITTDTFSSDSGDVSDLSAVDVTEYVQKVTPPTGSLLEMGFHAGGYTPATVTLPDGTTVLDHFRDKTAIRVKFLDPRNNDGIGGGHALFAQVHDFRDARTGAVDIPIPHSGYTITFDIKRPHGSRDWHLTTTKKGADVTVKGSHSAPGLGGPITTVATIENPLVSGP
jgi:hypothetical protein